MAEDTLIHLDGLAELALRAGDAHSVAGELDYERFGVCTTDLVHVANSYTKKTLSLALEFGGGPSLAMRLQFLAGFDLGYQARLEVERREVLNGEDNS